MTEVTEDKDIKFICPNDGEIERDDVVFLCNNCKREELIFRNGMYICPSCLIPGKNFECMLCESKDVKMVVED